MLASLPWAAKYPHQAFALRSEDVREARSIAMLQIAGEPWHERMIAWLARPREMRSDLRRTSLDPRLVHAIARLRSITGERAAAIAAALAGWSATPREVFAVREDDAMRRALRTEQVVALGAVAIILDHEIEELARAIGEMELPPAPAPVLPDDDELETVDVPDGIAHRAHFDLSLGTHSETLRLLEELVPDLGKDVCRALVGDDPLVPFPALRDAHDAATDEGAQIQLSRLHFWKTGPALDEIADHATGVADVLARIEPAVRAQATLELDRDVPAELAGGDYVASAEARLRAIARDAREAAQEGLLVLSEMSRSLSY